MTQLTTYQALEIRHNEELLALTVRQLNNLATDADLVELKNRQAAEFDALAPQIEAEYQAWLRQARN